jgi:acyl-homoserine lactone acylase PvdQ
MVLAISNQRLWTDGQTHSWSSDDRAQRITEIFDGNLGGDLVELSQKAQLDTKSRFAKELLTFIASNLEQGEGNRETLKRWSQWAGVSDQEGAKTYQDSLNAEEHLTNIVLALILEKYDRQQTVQSYKHLLRRGWLTRIISEPAILERLGVDAKELSQVIYRRVLRDRKEIPYQIRNRWQAQHLFAGNVPIIGNLFKVESFPQFGSSYVLRVEGPANTASMRLIWDLEEPRNSRWSFPVGQSGHLRSEHFDDLRKNWSKGVYQPIFL